MAHAASADAALADAAVAAEKRLLLFGDSLTAGYGLSEAQGFAAQLQRALDARGHTVEVINAGVSGDTSAGGLARLDWSLASKPTHALLELGANDALRGLDPAAMEQNLDGIITGMKDAALASKAYMRKWDEMWPDATVLDLPKAGHYWQEDDPDAAATAIIRAYGA